MLIGAVQRRGLNPCGSHGMNRSLGDVQNRSIVFPEERTASKSPSESVLKGQWIKPPGCAAPTQLNRRQLWMGWERCRDEPKPIARREALSQPKCPLFARGSCQPIIVLALG